jgi:hypothetical protein
MMTEGGRMWSSTISLIRASMLDGWSPTGTCNQGHYATNAKLRPDHAAPCISACWHGFQSTSCSPTRVMPGRSTSVMVLHMHANHNDGSCFIRIK